MADELAETAEQIEQADGVDETPSVGPERRNGRGPGLLLGILVGLIAGAAAAALLGHGADEEPESEAGLGEPESPAAGLRSALARVRSRVREASKEAQEAAREVEERYRARYEELTGQGE